LIIHKSFLFKQKQTSMITPNLYSAKALILFAFLFPLTLLAQSPKHEIGLRISNFSNLNPSFIYKKQLKEHTYRRITAGFADLSLNFNKNNNNARLTTGLTIGLEKRTQLSEKLKLMRGPQFITNIGFANSNTTSDTKVNTKTFEGNIGVGYGYLLGVLYELPANFYLSFEITPSVNLNYKYDRSKSSGFDASDAHSVGLGGWLNNFIAAGIVYKFDLKK
jgi:long-subunit fatty acid transport protein